MRNTDILLFLFIFRDILLEIYLTSIMFTVSIWVLIIVNILEIFSIRSFNNIYKGCIEQSRSLQLLG